MARIATKEYVAARQMKKRRLYSRGQTRRCSLRLCYRRRGDKQTMANRACDRFGGNVGHQNLRRRKQRKPRRSGADVSK